MVTNTTLPKVTRYVSGLAAVGIVAVAGVALLEAWRVEPIAGVLLILHMATLRFPLRFRSRTGDHGITLDEAVLLGALFALPVSMVPALLMFSTAAAHLLARRDLTKVAFNSGQVGLGASAAGLLFHLVGAPTDVLTLQGAAAAALAALVFNGLSVVALAELFRRLEGADRPRLDAVVTRMNLIVLGGNVWVGALLAFAASTSPAAAVLATVALLGSFFGYRGYARVVEERDQELDFRALSPLLVRSLSRPGDHEELLRRAATFFAGNSAVLALLTPDRVHLSDSEGAHEALPDRSLDPVIQHALRTRASVAVTDEDPEWAPLLRLSGHRDALVAPIVYEERLRGALAIYDRVGLEAWSAAHTTLLLTLANEAAAVLENAELFGKVEEERGRFEEESRKLGDIVDAASDGIVTIAADGTVVLWNQAMETATGVPSSTATGLPWHVALRLREPGGSEFAEEGSTPLHRVLSGAKTQQTMDAQVLRRDGEWRWLRCSIAPIQREGGPLAGAVVVARDVTRDREVEGLKNDFVSTVSHELRTPLTPLRGFLETLRTGRLALDGPRAMEALDAMNSQVDRLERLVGDLLVVADADHGALSLRFQPIDLEAAARRALVDGVPQGDRERVTIVESGGSSARGDAAATQRILRALLDNAVKHTSGPVRVEFGAGHDTEAVRVSDEGMGIPPWEQERVFGRFHRLGDHLHRTQGSGLGLPIARSLARAMGGDVRLHSDVGSGCTFELSLPRARGSRGRDVDEPSSPATAHDRATEHQEVHR